MVSPELLRRYSFFAGLSDAQLKEIAMIAEEATYEKGTVILEENGTADTLYVLMTGSVDLFYGSAEPYYPKTHKKFLVGEINPGEPFGLSAVIEPHIWNATAHAAQTCNAIKIDAVALLKLMAEDCELGYKIMVQIAKALRERLSATRVQLAAAWAE